MRTPKSEEAAGIRREHLLRVLSELVERTWSMEGQEAGRRQLHALLGRLDDTALRELAYRSGITTEADLEPGEGERRP